LLESIAAPANTTTEPQRNTSTTHNQHDSTLFNGPIWKIATVAVLGVAIVVAAMYLAKRHGHYNLCTGICAL